MSSQKQRRKQRRPSRRLPSKSSAYRKGVRKADELLSKNDIEPRHDNWQQLALHWFAPKEPERGVLANYITECEDELGVSWAREILRRSTQALGPSRHATRPFHRIGALVMS